MRIGWTALALGSMAVATLICSCHGDLNPFHDSPSSVIKKLFENCNAGNYSKAEAALSPDAQQFLQGTIGALAGGIKGICDKGTRNGTLSSVEILTESTRGEGADVTARLHYKDGSTNDDHESLVKVDGDWKIALGR
jgi:Domain of unknown function (DUF4878)